MFERYTERARRVLFFARYEASQLGSMSIETEHLLLGLLRQPESTAGAILTRAGLRLPAVRESIVSLAAIQKSDERHVVLVLVTIRPEMQEEFEAALLHNARESIRLDPGCLRFDVSQDKDHPARWVLYEVYDGPAEHALHRQSPHFLAYDAVAARAVVEKTVAKCAGRFVT